MPNMYNLDEAQRERENKFIAPSFSSTLLDQIYRSIDEGERNNGETKFYRHTTMSTAKKQSRSHSKSMDAGKTHTKLHRDEDVLFFSSTSVSSDSSFGFSSDSESLSRASCFTPRGKHVVRGSASFRAEKQGMRVFDGLCRNPHTSEEHVAVRDEESRIKSKSRALRIYNNLKKVKQPISPGGRVTSFLNSLFANTKKTSSRTSTQPNASTSTSTSTSSSSSSLSRSCLSNKTMSSERDRLHNGVKRTVRFYPVSVIVGEDSRPCGHKRLCEEEEASREFLREYSRHDTKNISNDLISKNFSSRATNIVDDEEGDDASSCASSDLFELDHLSVFGSARYCEELPVYETTHLSTNRAIANGLI